MSGDRTSVGTEPQVVDYLRTLDIALVRLPRADAVELRQQIVEHLEESVTTESDNEQIAEVLHRLGRPEDLVAESLRPRPRRRSPRLRAWPWHRWVLAGVVLAILGSGIGYVVNMAHQPALRADCQPCGWYYLRDGVRGHDIDTLTGDEMLTPDRPGQLQGFVFTIQNRSSWPETLLGVDSESDISIGTPHPPTIAVGTVDPEHDGLFRGSPYVDAPVVIQPGQYRFVRVTWRSARCYLIGSGTQGTDIIGVRVKIGWFTHDQTLQLPETWALRGVAQPNCPNPRRG
jgi:hypothetical protein